jgi:hypothetical protein
MELIAGTENISSQGFPTSTPVLDVLRPLPSQDSERLTTGDYFFISSAVIVAFTGLRVIRAFVDAVSHQSLVMFWTALLLLPVLAFLAAVIAHQSGHLLMARIFRFRAVQIKIGPFSVRDQLAEADVLSLGFLVMRPNDDDRLRRRLAYLVFGGPLASILLPVAAEALLHFAQSQWGPMYVLVPAGVHVFSALSFLLGIGSLLPDIDASGNFSDGTRLLMLLKNDFRCARWLAIVELQVALNAGERVPPSTEVLIARATAYKDDSFDTVAANWLAYLQAMNRQDLGAGSKYLEEALNGLGSSPGHLRDRIFLEAAIFQGWYRYNSSKARFWASQIARLESIPERQRLRLEIAVLWAEGRSFDAWEWLAKYLEYIREMPSSHTRDVIKQDALEWKDQMESRMLSGAWATMHSWPHERQMRSIIPRACPEVSSRS